MLKQRVADLVRQPLNRLGVDWVRVSEPYCTRDGLLSAYATRVHLKELFRRRDFTHALDVGANQGQFATLLRRIGFRGVIHSFEPVPALYRKLEDKSRSDQKWKVHPQALSDTDGKAPFHVNRAMEMSSLYPMKPEAMRWSGLTASGRVEQSIEVPTARLDSLFDDLISAGGRVFAKLDTQGNDAAVLAGGQDSLAKIDALQVELRFEKVYDTPFEDAFEAQIIGLRERGFEITGLYPVLRDATSLRIIEIDCILINTRSEQRPSGTHGRDL